MVVVIWSGVVDLALQRRGGSLPRQAVSAPAMSAGGPTAVFGAEVITVSEGARTLLVGAEIKRRRYKTLEASWDVESSLDELGRLCETAGLEVMGRTSQAMQNPSPSTFLGSGKVQELRETVSALRIQSVVFDEELSPAQGRNLQDALGGKVQVLDRTMLILQIFSQRARTREAKLQVQAAQMRYMLPRLQTFMTTGAGMDAKGGGSGGGGGGLKGAGESQLEADKRLFRKQLQRLELEMEDVRAKRELHRAKRRERDDLPLVAIVGYTNAGKSTLLNTLCGSTEVYADDLYFATLDPTTRRVRLPGGKEVLLSDTVGFIQKLPTKLVSAFRATLEELQEASLILHVVDSSSALARQQVWSVQNIIEELEADATPQVLVLNKADALNGLPLNRSEWVGVHERVAPSYAVMTSAKLGKGLPRLLETVERALLRLAVRVECRVPYAAGDLLAEVHKTGTVVEEEYEPAGTRVVAFVPPSLRNRLSAYAI